MGRGQGRTSLSGRSQRTPKRTTGSDAGTMMVDGVELEVVNDVNNLPVVGKRRQFIMVNDDGSQEGKAGYVEGNIAFTRGTFTDLNARDPRPGSEFNENTWQVVHLPTGKLIGEVNEGVFSDPRTGATFGGYRLHSLRSEIAPSLNRELGKNGAPKRGADLETKLNDIVFGDVQNARSGGGGNLDFLFGTLGDDAVPF